MCRHGKPHVCMSVQYPSQQTSYELQKTRQMLKALWGEPDLEDMLDTHMVAAIGSVVNT